MQKEAGQTTCPIAQCIPTQECILEKSIREIWESSVPDDVKNTEVIFVLNKAISKGCIKIEGLRALKKS